MCEECQCRWTHPYVLTHQIGFGVEEGIRSVMDTIGLMYVDFALV